jgi:AcrR family transcriptional regulator
MPGTKVPEEQRRAQIVEATFRVAAQTGLQSVTVRSVAHEAGVSVGLVLFHFRAMDALHLALLDWLVARVLVIEGQGAGEEADPGQWLLGLVRQQLEEAQQQRAEIELFIAYWLRSAQEPAIREAIRAALGRYREALRAAVDVWFARTQPKVGALAPEALALLLTTVIEGYALQVIHEPEAVDPGQVLAALQSLIT